MLQDKLVNAAQHRGARAVFAAGPMLTELLSDPIMHMLMAADRVAYREIEAVLQKARSQTRTDARRVICTPSSRGVTTR